MAGQVDPRLRLPSRCFSAACLPWLGAVRCPLYPARAGLKEVRLALALGKEASLGYLRRMTPLGLNDTSKCLT